MINKAYGFTLIELLVVVALIMILSLVGVGSYTIATVKSKDTLRKGELSQIVRALESFNQDVGRYPLSDESNNILCYTKANGTVTNPSCTNGKLSTTIDGEVTNYMTLPKDPDPNLKYVYISTDGATFGLYAKIENSSDKDLLTLGNGVPDQDPWGISCGNEQCNYKITEEGLAKSKNE